MPASRAPASPGGALAILLSACGNETAGPEQAPSLIESDVTGTWRATVPAPYYTAKVTMDIRADHTIGFSQQLMGLVPGAPDSTMDWLHETGTWSLEANTLSYLKLDCRYARTPGQPLKNEACDAPASKSYTPTLKDGKMIVVEGKTPYTFTRD